MASESQARRLTKGSIILTLVVLGAVAIGMALIASALAKLGILQTVALTLGYLAGAIFGQAKDVANKEKFSGDLWQNLQRGFFAAWSNEYGAAFIFRSLEFGILFAPVCHSAQMQAPWRRT